MEISARGRAPAGRLPLPSPPPYGASLRHATVEEDGVVLLVGGPERMMMRISSTCGQRTAQDRFLLLLVLAGHLPGVRGGETNRWAARGEALPSFPAVIRRRSPTRLKSPRSSPQEPARGRGPPRAETRGVVSGVAASARRRRKGAGGEMGARSRPEEPGEGPSERLRAPLPPPDRRSFRRFGRTPAGEEPGTSSFDQEPQVEEILILSGPPTRRTTPSSTVARRRETP